MPLDDKLYEDELDRMQARKQKRKNQNVPVPEPDEPDDDFQFYDDLTQISEANRNIQAGTPTDRLAGGKASAPRRSGQKTKQTKVAGKTAGKMPKRKRHKKWKLIALILACICGFFMFQRIRDDGYYTVAVFGVDSRDGNVGKGALSDVVMVCSINKKTGEMRLVSVFRDSYFNIGNDKYTKINQAYSDGGPSQAVTALENNLDIKVDDYATFNWKAVVDGINILGGIDLEISEKEFVYINSFITATVEGTGVGSVHLEHSGMNHLDGVQAVAYARLRLMDTDFNRTKRQRKVLGLAMDKAKAADFNTKKTLVGTVFPQISTSIGVDNLLSMARNSRKYYIGQTSGYPFSHQEMKVNKKDCVIPTTLESNVIQLHEFLYDNANYTPSTNLRRISNYIAEVTGLTEPGKDTETGKNIGVSGQINEAQPATTAARQVTESPQTAAETAATEPLTESSTAEETTAEASLPTETATQEIPPEPTATIITPPTTEPATDEPAGPGANSNNGPVNIETSGALEGPGQGNHNSVTEVGPGVS